MKNFADSLKSKISPHSLVLIGIVLASVALRLAAALYMGNGIESLPGIDDQRSYHMLAQRVMQGHGFTVATDWWPVTLANQPTAHWSYLYTMYLVGVYSLAGTLPMLARVIQVVIVGIAWPLLAYRISQRITLNVVGINGTVGNDTAALAKRAALIAAAWSAAYPYFVYYSAGLLTESFYIILVLWTIDLTLGIAEKLKATLAPAGLTRQWLMLGIAIAAAVLLRQLFLILVPFLFVWMAWATRTRAASSIRVLPMRQHWTMLLCGGLCVAAVVALCIAPWTVLNYQNFHKFVLLNTNAGFAFFWANHPIYGTRFVEVLPNDMYTRLIPDDLYALDEASLSTALFQLGVRQILDDPLRYILLSLSRIQIYFNFWPSPNSGLFSNLTRITSFGLALPFAVYGLVLSLRHWRSWSLLYVFIAVYTAIHLLSWALVRYRLPVDATLLMFAAYSMAHLVGRLQNRVRRNTEKDSQLAFPAEISI